MTAVVVFPQKNTRRDHKNESLSQKMCLLITPTPLTVFSSAFQIPMENGEYE